MNTRYQTIKTSTHLIVVDNEAGIKEGDWVIDTANDTLFQVKETHSSFIWDEKYKEFVYSSCEKLIASYPKLEGVAEFCELPEDSIKKLAKDYRNSWGKFGKTEESYYGFIAGYEASEKKYSEEDMREFAQWMMFNYKLCTDNDFDWAEKMLSEFIEKQSLSKTPQLEVEEYPSPITVGHTEIGEEGKDWKWMPKIIDEKLQGKWINL